MDMERRHCLYTTRLTQKQKRWQDGRVAFNRYVIPDPHCFLACLLSPLKLTLPPPPFSPTSRATGYVVLSKESGETLHAAHLPEAARQLAHAAAVLRAPLPGRSR